jgi:hypothetical protein
MIDCGIHALLAYKRIEGWMSCKICTAVAPPIVPVKVSVFHRHWLTTRTIRMKERLSVYILRTMKRGLTTLTCSWRIVLLHDQMLSCVDIPTIHDHFSATLWDNYHLLSFLIPPKKLHIDGMILRQEAK